MTFLPIIDEPRNAAPRSLGLSGGASQGMVDLCIASMTDGGGFSFMLDTMP